MSDTGEQKIRVLTPSAHWGQISTCRIWWEWVVSIFFSLLNLDWQGKYLWSSSLGYLVWVLSELNVSLSVSGFSLFILLYVLRASPYDQWECFLSGFYHPERILAKVLLTLYLAMKRSQGSFLCLSHSFQRWSIISSSWRTVMYLVDSRISCGSKLRES